MWIFILASEDHIRWHWLFCLASSAVDSIDQYPLGSGQSPHIQCFTMNARLTLRPGRNWPAFCRQHFQLRFLLRTLGYLIKFSLRFGPLVCIKLLWARDTIWRHRSGSTLAQVMACCLMAMTCCLTAPDLYLNQCWLLISEVLWHLPVMNSTLNPKPLFYFPNYR